jgi:phosphohistidine phosphatase
MKQLILVRHAKSSWDVPAHDDIARPLNPRGLRDAPEMGRRIAHGPYQPELIISSAAERARNTAELIAHELGYKQSAIKLERNLYCFDAESLLQQIKQFDNSNQRILCVGHNPAITAVVNQLCGEHIDNVPTCGVCYLQFESSRWADISAGILIDFDYPKKTAES